MDAAARLFPPSLLLLSRRASRIVINVTLPPSLIVCVCVCVCFFLLSREFAGDSPIFCYQAALIRGGDELTPWPGGLVFERVGRFQEGYYIPKLLTM